VLEDNTLKIKLNRSISLPQRLIWQTRFLDDETKEILSALVRYLAIRLREKRSQLIYGHLVRRSRIKHYMQSHTERKLHFGAGAQHLQGFLNSDRSGRLPINIGRRLPFNNEEIDLIYTSHVVEHLPKEDFKSFLHECLRILKKGGANIIAVPSIEKLSSILYGKDSAKIDALKTYFSAHFMEEEIFAPCEYLNLIMKGFDHKYLYDFALIEHLAKKTGYSAVERIANSDAPDEILKDHIIKREAYWELETETFLLIK
jgi:predicted SAM-dependent methyltransferase